jgi:hypothetical protein
LVNNTTLSVGSNIRGGPGPSFFCWQIFIQFQPEKYDLNQYKDFSQKKWPKVPDFKDKFKQVAKNIEGFWFYFYFLI